MFWDVVLVVLGLILYAHAAYALGINEAFLGVRDLHAEHLLKVRVLLGASNGSGDFLEEPQVVTVGEYFEKRNVEVIEKYLETLKIFT